VTAEPSALVRFGTTVKDLAGRWTAYTAFGSFALYLLGYLALRFHLTALGVGTDLSVLDERYLFTGARFVVYLAAAVPSAMVLLALAGAVAFLLARALPRRVRAIGRDGLERLRASPGALATIGIVLSLALIQLCMRECFFLTDVLLDPGRFRGQSRILAALVDQPWSLPVFFAVLVACAAIVAALAVMAADAAGPEARLSPARATLGIVLAIQLLLLPVNFGYLVVDKSLPRVTAINAEPLGAGEMAWLVWEGKDGMTYLVCRPAQGRTLVTLPRQKVERVEIKAYDPWTRLPGCDAPAGDGRAAP
jgi:hypothetical protein